MKRFMFACAAVAGMAGTASAQEIPTGSWAFETSAYNFARGGCATDGTYLYLFGGYQLGVSASYPSYYRRARRYDPAANAWITIANLPIVESNITYQYNAGAYSSGRLYSFGTSYADGNGIVISYSIADNAWTVLTGVALPENRYAAAAATLGDLIYISGGFAGSAPSARLDAFDPSTNTFTRVADLPVGLHRHAMVAAPARNSLFAIGGSSGGDYEATCYEYSPSTDAWTQRASMNVDGEEQPRGYPAAFVLMNRIYVTGGHTGDAASATTLEYHPAQNTWRQRGSMSSARYQHGAVAIGEAGFVYGGLPDYTEGEEFTPPGFGPAPELETEPVQIGSQPESSLQAKEDPELRDGWMNGMVTFRAAISDPDAGQSVRLRVRLRRPLEPAWMELASGWVEQGTAQINFWLPTPHAYDWEYRIEDAEGNSYPAGEEVWLPAFGNDSSPDLRCNRSVPTEPVAVTPKEDVGVGDPVSGDVAFSWIESTDDGPGLVYDFEITLGEETEAWGTAPAGSGGTLRLPVSSETRWWRMRARDIAGNTSPWTAPLPFRVVYDDRLDHAAGDALKSCGYGAGVPASTGGLALAVAVCVGASVLLPLRRCYP